MQFLIDKKNIYTYDDLLDRVNKMNFYFPYYKTSDLFLFFSNFVFAVSNNLPITLIDSDINSSELDEEIISKINEKVSINHSDNSSIDGLIDRCFNSTSEIMLFTSGTTGQPKKVIHNIQSLTRNVRKGEKHQKDIWGFAYNPTHMAGTQVFFQAFINKNSIINLFNIARTDVFKAIIKNSITHISATPTFYRLLLPFETAYTSIRRVTFGGEKSDNSLYKAIEMIFPNAKINNIYASTEAGSIFTSKGEYFQIPECIKEKIDFLDDELLLHKSLLGSSIEDIVLTNEFYHTGDLVEWIDKTNGIFKFKSRKNELINVGGYKVNPNEVEKEITAIDGVKQAVVYGKTNSVLGNILCADIVTMNDQVTELTVRTSLSKKLQDYKIPRRIKFVESIELTRTGKTKRK